jgi:hypothetical protein
MSSNQIQAEIQHVQIQIPTTSFPMQAYSMRPTSKSFRPILDVVSLV